MSAVDCYFMCMDGSMFKARVPHAPYFYLQVRPGAERDVDAWLRRRFEARVRDVEVVEREDLDLVRLGMIRGDQMRWDEIRGWDEMRGEEMG